MLTSISAGSLYANAAQEHRFNGNLNILGNYNSSGETWLDGGLGRYGWGEEKYDSTAAYELNAAYEYRPSQNLRFVATIQAQDASFSSSASELGFVEWFGRYKYQFDFNQQLSIKAGQFFLPTSMENIGAFWESPYTITFSSLNSWIGEEFRPIGADVRYRYDFDSGNTASISVTPFWGNDSMGALLAFRGWTYGRQRTAYNDVLALPDIESIADGQVFEGQRNDGTKPFGHDLDDRPGYALRASYLSDRLSLNLSWVDNRGDTTLIDSEYAWRTKFLIFGMSWFATENLELLGEASSGSTTMGAGPGVDISFYSTYLMASYRVNDYRISARYDQFGIDDEDDVDQESNEIGRSYTVALMWNRDDSPITLGTEAMYLDSKRSKRLSSGQTEQDEESVSVSLLAQYQF